MPETTLAPEPPAQEPTTDTPPQADPLDALEGLANPFLSPEGGVEKPQETPQPREAEADQKIQEEASDALARALGKATPEEPQEAAEEPDQDPAPDAQPDRKKANKGLRDQLRERNQAYDQLNEQMLAREAKLKELEQELQQTQQERFQAQESLTKKYNVGDYDEKTDPDVERIGQDLRMTLNEAKVALPADQAIKLEGNMEALVSSYQKTLAGADPTRLHNVIEEHFPGSKREVLHALGNLNRKIEERANLIQENRSKHFQSVIGGYEERLTETRNSLSEVGSLEMEAALKSPTALNSIISVAAQQDEGYKKRVQDIQAKCASIAAGVRPFDVRDSKWKDYLDPMDPTKLSPEGEELRRKEVFQYEATQRELPRTLCEMWSAALLVPQLVEKIAQYEARVADDQLDPDPKIAHDEDRPSTNAPNIDFENANIHDVKNPFV